MEDKRAINKIKTYNGFRLSIDFDEGDSLYGEIIEGHLTYEEVVKREGEGFRNFRALLSSK